MLPLCVDRPVCVLHWSGSWLLLTQQMDTRWAGPRHRPQRTLFPRSDLATLGPTYTSYYVSAAAGGFFGSSTTRARDDSRDGPSRIHSNGCCYFSSRTKCK